MAQSLRNSLKRQSLCRGSQSWADRGLPRLSLAEAGGGDGPGPPAAALPPALAADENKEKEKSERESTELLIQFQLLFSD